MFNAILVVVDRYGKMLRYILVTKKIDAAELVEVFVDVILSKYGSPTGIVSDRGLVFTSSFWSEVYFYTKVKRRLSTAFYL